MRISDLSSDLCSSDLKSYALFTHLNYRVSDLIGITLGGRYTKEDKTLVASQRDLNMLLTKLGTPAFLFPDPTDLSQFYPTGEQKLSFSNVSPRVGIELHPTERIMLYGRSEEHTSELQSLMRISSAVFCLKKK